MVGDGRLMLSKDYVLHILRQATASDKTGLTAQDVAARIGIDRSTASRYLNALVSEGQVDKLPGKPRRFVAKGGSDEAALLATPSKFSTVIGCDGSLKEIIRDAEAAVSYPTQKMHCILIGPSGSGKTMLAQMIYDFGVARGVFSPERFVSFNCADYASNPQLLLSQLYGHAKYAFTGANSDKPGIVEKADIGVLFLDEVHRLPPEGQEMLFSLMDFGIYTRMGESTKRSANVFVVAATSENVDSKLLGTFLRRFAVQLVVPGFSERPIPERILLVLSFIQQEATNLGRDVRVKRDIVEELASGNYRGNVRELKNRIQLLVARAYLKSITSPSSELVLSNDMTTLGSSFPVNREIAAYVRAVLPETLAFRGEPFNKGNIKPDEFNLSEFINNRFRAHQEKGLHPQEVTAVVDAELTTLFRTVNAATKQEQVTVEQSVLSAVNRALANYCEKTGKRISSTASFWIAAHLSSVVDMLRKGTYDTQEGLYEAVYGDTTDFETAQFLVQDIKRSTGLPIPDEEINRLTILIREASQQLQGKDDTQSFASNRDKCIIIFCFTGRGSAQICKDRIVALGIPEEAIATVQMTDLPVNNPFIPDAVYIGPFNPGVPEDQFIRMDRVFTEKEEVLHSRLVLALDGFLSTERASLVQSVLQCLDKAGKAILGEQFREVVFDIARRIQRFETYYGLHLDDGLFASILLHFVAANLKGRRLEVPNHPIHEFETVMQMSLQPAEIELLCKVCNAQHVQIQN